MSGDKQAVSKSSPRSFISRAKWFAKDQWVILSLFCLIIVASLVQVPKSHQAIKSEVVQNVTIATIFFVNGCTISPRDFLSNLGHWKQHIFIQTLCFLMTSAIALGIVAAAATNEAFVDPALLNGIVLLGCLPTAFSFTTLMAKKANGNAALTVAESVIGSILGPLVSTGLIEAYSSVPTWYAHVLPNQRGRTGIVLAEVFKDLGLILFLPLVVGQIVLYFFPRMTHKVMEDWSIRRVASLALLANIWSSYDKAFETDVFSTLETDNIIFIILTCIVLFVVWMGISFLLSYYWLPPADTIAAAFSVPTKAPILGLALIAIIYREVSELTAVKLYLPMIIFQCVQMCLSSLATTPLRLWRERRESMVVEARRDEDSAERGMVQMVQDDRYIGNCPDCGAPASHHPGGSSFWKDRRRFQDS
ncbi:sodium bile acid symporter family protein [Xylariaceae sp. FL0016]|nr:sodium bile acid symporter family protein [Xylariaceae sp. FL0016]